jgi:hypothetical protein
MVNSLETGFITTRIISADIACLKISLRSLYCVDGNRFPLNVKKNRKPFCTIVIFCLQI